MRDGYNKPILLFYRKTEERRNGMFIDTFGSNVFNDDVRKKYLKPATYKKLENIRNEGAPMDQAIAEEVAAAMMKWAVEKGATHYTHWFQPMTGITAEKHDSFITPAPDGGVIMEFSGKELIKGEPDASSFPSGGLRATFEARGYTAWDPASYAFVKDHTLYIPTAFCSYTGEALDTKTPLLRSMDAISTQALRILRLFGDEKTSKVTAQLGPEQEYFLVDKELLQTREDLRLGGHTLFGARPPKGQELDDHYFGAIRPRVSAYMQELDEELWKLGIYAKTKHNEVAPCQHEMAPIYSDANNACDSNQLVMEIMKKCAAKHDLVCLLHEKPFDGVNGSGKHNNWSLSTPEMGSLFSPGTTPHSNLLFLILLASVIRAIDLHGDMLRASISKAGNDHRLGAQEAPPSIISIFLGDQLMDIIEQIKKGGAKRSAVKSQLKLGVDTLPTLPQDTSDRNRTSPFAFTGNKFEFRGVGASQTCAWPMTILNTIVAESLDYVASKLEPHAGKPDFNAAVAKLLREMVTKHDRVIFNGNGYSQEWVKEAERRGLPNIKSAEEAMEVMVRKDTIALMDKYSVLTKAESVVRKEVLMENYIKLIDIEAKTCLNMLRTIYAPAIETQLTAISNTVYAIKASGLKAGLKTAQAKATRIGELYDEIPLRVAALEKAIAACVPSKMRAAMEAARTTVDTLETIVDADLWPVPTYAQMLNIHSK